MSLSLIKRLGEVLFKKNNTAAAETSQSSKSKRESDRSRSKKSNSGVQHDPTAKQTAGETPRRRRRPRRSGKGENMPQREERIAGTASAAPTKPRRRNSGNGENDKASPTTERTGRERTLRRRNEAPNSNRQSRSARRRVAAEATERNAAMPGSTDASAVTAAPWSIDSFQVAPREGTKRFHDFDLPLEIMHAIADLGFEYCTPIQAASLEQALAGANVAGRAQTGTGKTAAFLIAILTRYWRTPDRRAERPATPRALILAPTRELCVQISNDAVALGKYSGLRSLAVFGGMDYNRQQRQLAEGTVDILTATPGRLIDFVRQRVVDLSQVDTVVIDEADRMLDMGFIPDVRRIISALPPREKRQTLLYSATLDDEVMRLARQWMPDPVRVDIEPEHVASDTIEQHVYIVTSDQKFTLLCNVLKRYANERVLIFGNRRVSTDRLAERLMRQGFKCELLSGDVQQSRRMRVLEKFRSGEVKVVVATDVAGRGLHIADIGLVVNYELPYEAEDYVHRIGRTGRAGNIGKALAFACEDESFQIPEIEKYLGEELKCVQPPEELLVPLAQNSGATTVWRRSRRGRGSAEAGTGGRHERGGRRPGGNERRESSRKEVREQRPAEVQESAVAANSAATAIEPAAAPVDKVTPQPPIARETSGSAPETVTVRAIPPPSAMQRPHHARSQVWTPGKG